MLRDKQYKIEKVLFFDIDFDDDNDDDNDIDNDIDDDNDSDIKKRRKDSLSLRLYKFYNFISSHHLTTNFLTELFSPCCIMMK